jgi:hypothetical protein
MERRDSASLCEEARKLRQESRHLEVEISRLHQELRRTVKDIEKSLFESGNGRTRNGGIGVRASMH